MAQGPATHLRVISDETGRYQISLAALKAVRRVNKPAVISRADEAEQRAVVVDQMVEQPLELSYLRPVWREEHERRKMALIVTLRLHGFDRLDKGLAFSEIPVRAFIVFFKSPDVDHAE